MFLAPHLSPQREGYYSKAINLNLGVCEGLDNSKFGLSTSGNTCFRLSHETCPLLGKAGDINVDFLGVV